MGHGGAFDVFIPPYGPSKYRQIEQLLSLRRLQLPLGRLLRPAALKRMGTRHRDMIAVGVGIESQRAVDVVHR